MVPLDILEKIVYVLLEERATQEIRECALTCKSLAPICQRRLFEDIKLVHAEGPWDTVPVHGIEQFHQHLSNYPHLGTYIRALELVCRPAYRNGEPFRVLDLLDHVHTLTFGFSESNLYITEGLSWSSEMTKVIKDLVASLINRNPVASLSLICTSDVPVSLLQKCGDLRHLSLYNATPSIRDFDSSLPAVSLEYFKIEKGLSECANSPFFLSSGCIDLSELITLCITSESQDEDSAIHRILGHPKRLEVLQIDLTRNTREWSCHGNIISRLAKTSMESLKSIKIVLLTDNDRAGTTPRFPTLGGLIPELALIPNHNKVEEIDLEIVVCQLTKLSLDVDRHNELDSVLSKGFPQLRTLRLSITKYFYDDPEDPWKGKADFEEEWNAFFQDEANFKWCKENLKFRTEVSGEVI